MPEAQSYEQAEAASQELHSPEFTKQVEESRRSFENLLVDYINETTESLDKWLVTLSGIGLSASFGALASGNVATAYVAAMQTVSVLLSAALCSALLSKGVGSWGATQILSKVRDAKKLGPSQCRDLLDSIDFHQYDRIVLRLNSLCFVLIIFSVAAIVFAIMRAPQEVPTHEQQQREQQNDQ